MRNRLSPFVWTTPSAALSDERGVAAVEFALLGTLLLTLLAGGVDLTNALIVQRDVDRLSNEVAQALTGCGGESCVVSNGSAINARLQNIALGLDGITVGFTNIQRLNNTIVAQGGNMTYLPADMTTVAKSVLPNEKDWGVATLVTYTHKPILLSFAKDWGFNVAEFRSYAVTLRVKA
jgi:Flp pilus assembly protein TadG